MPMFKAGVVMWKMAPEIEEWMERLDAVHLKTVDRKAIITSARDGIHRSESLHYEGRAIDLRTRDLNERQQRLLRDELKRSLGSDYDVVLESDHLHVEYDPD